MRGHMLRIGASGQLEWPRHSAATVYKVGGAHERMDVPEMEKIVDAYEDARISKRSSICGHRYVRMLSTRIEDEHERA